MCREFTRTTKAHADRDSNNTSSTTTVHPRVFEGGITSLWIISAIVDGSQISGMNEAHELVGAKAKRDWMMYIEKEEQRINLAYTFHLRLATRDESDNFDSELAKERLSG